MLKSPCEPSMITWGHRGISQPEVIVGADWRSSRPAASSRSVAFVVSCPLPALAYLALEIPRRAECCHVDNRGSKSVRHVTLVAPLRSYLTDARSGIIPPSEQRSAP